MKLTFRVPEDAGIDPVSLSKAVQWAVRDGYDSEKIWRLNSVPAIAQLEEAEFIDGQGDISEYLEDLRRSLGLPAFDAATAAVLEKARRSGPMPGQTAFNWDEGQHPREGAGTHDPNHKPGEFVSKETPKVEDTPEELERMGRVRLDGWSGQIDAYTGFLNKHQTGTEPRSPHDLEQAKKNFLAESAYFQEKLSHILPADSGPEGAEFYRRKHELYRKSNNLEMQFADEIRLGRLENPEYETGWQELEERGHLLEMRAYRIADRLRDKAYRIEDEDPEEFGRLVGEASALQADAEKAAKALKKQATKEKNAIKKYQKGTKETGQGFDRRQDAREREIATRYAWKWENDSEIADKGQAPAGTYVMSHEVWNQSQEKKWLGDKSERFAYLGPQGGRQEEEADRMKTRMVKRVPAWLRNRILGRGGSVMFSAGPPQRVGWESQEAYFKWLTDHPKVSDNDPRHWDEVAGFYRHRDKNAYNQVGYSNDTGCVNLELHEYGHMVDFLFNEDGTRLSDSPEFVSIWENLKPWLDNYYTKDHNAKELFAEGFDVFTESEANRKLLLSNEVPPAYQRLGRYFERLLAEPAGEGELSKSIRLVLKGPAPVFEEGRDDVQTAKGPKPNRFASGQTVIDGVEYCWDGEPVHEENPPERDPRFPTLFLKHPRQPAEKAE